MKGNLEKNIGAFLTIVIGGLIVLGFFWKPYDPNEMDSAAKLLPPSLLHILGTDNFGRDVLSRILQGAGTTLTIATAAVSIGAIGGLILGSVTGYFGGLADEILMGINDTITAFPSLLLTLVFISLTGPGKYNIIVALGILFIPSFARVVRGEFARCRDSDYIQWARLVGVPSFRIMLVHILPNIMSVLLSSIAIGFNNAVLAEASMSFLGLGVQPPEPSLGRMLSEAQTFFLTAPWYALSVGIITSLIILGFSLLGEGATGSMGLLIRRKKGYKYAENKGFEN